MKKKDKKETIKDLQKLKNEIAIDKVNDIFKNNPENYKEELAKIGFQWFDDEYPDEIEEEDNAVPENRNQEFLIAYFSGGVELSNSVIEAFLTEKYSDEPNFALIRRYFRQENQHLKSLIYFGIKINPDSTIRTGSSRTWAKLNKVFGGELEAIIHEINTARFIRFMRHILGLEKLESWPETVTSAFDDFIARHTTFSALQIRFLQTLKTFILQTGKVERENLITQPFTNLHPQGIRGLFEPSQIQEIMTFVEEIGQQAA